MMGKNGESSPLIGNQKEGNSLGLFSSVTYLVSVFGVPPIIVLPAAIEYCGVLGFVLVLALFLIVTYTAVLLSKSWMMMEDHWPQETSLYFKYPYSALAQRVGGLPLKRFVSIILNLAIFGESIPFLLLASENIQDVINGFPNQGNNFSFCYVLILTTIIVTPFLWHGTAKDLRYMTWVGAGSILVLWVLVMSLMFMDAPSSHSPPVIIVNIWSAYAYCFGAVAFQFGVHTVVLSVQMDMKDKHQLPKVIFTSFAAIFILSGIVGIAAFFLFGDSVQANLLNNFQNSNLLYITRVFVGVQSLICLALGMNALFQDLEEMMGLPDMFGWRRILFRTTMMLLVLFVAESIPHFAVALELVGGLLMTPIIFIFPPIFYIVIKHKTKGEVKLHEMILGAGVIALGLVGCVASTLESGMQISKLKEFAPPCYIDFEKASRSERPSVL